MKFFLLFLNFLIISQIYSDNVSYKDLVKINDVYYKKDTNKLFTGKIKGLIEGTFKEVKKNGEFISYYNDGKILSRINYIQNILDGNWIEFYRNGNLLIKKIYKNGELEGEYIDYYSFGQILSRRFYVNNKLDGIYEEFYKNGQLHIKKNYKEDLLEGEYIVYHEYEL